MPGINNPGSHYSRFRTKDASASVNAPSFTSDQIAALIGLLQSQQSQLSTDRLSG